MARRVTLYGSLVLSWGNERTLEASYTVINATEDLKDLAQSRLLEAEVLLAGGLWSGAYYLSGYALELGLKAAATKSLVPYCLPNKTVVSKLYTHDLDELTKLAGLKEAFTEAKRSNANFGANWGIATKWTEQSRYRTWSESKAREIVAAISDQNDGVLPWIKTHW